MRAALFPLLLGSALIGHAGCAHDLARASSSAIGCAPEALEISDVSVGWSRMSWTARCRDTTFYCSGESAAQCAPALTEPAKASRATAETTAEHEPTVGSVEPQPAPATSTETTPAPSSSPPDLPPTSVAPTAPDRTTAPDGPSNENDDEPTKD